MPQFLTHTFENARGIIALVGDWRLINAAAIEAEFNSLPSSGKSLLIIDAAQLHEFDTSGAVLLTRLLRHCANQDTQVQFQNFTPKHNNIIELVRARLENQKPVPVVSPLSLIQQVGRGTILFFHHVIHLVSFLGNVLSDVGLAILRPRLIRWKEIIVQLERVGVDAIPVVSLVTGLIGVVIAYLFSEQLKKYGGNIFIADGVSVAMCRELSPMIVAIIIAGRSGSAFTAQLGTMKLNQEIDAMVTIGLSPIHVLVIPRILALIIAMPLLVFVGDIVGTAGGMFIADHFLGVTPQTFIDRLQVALPPRMVWVGLCKAPVFAAIIAMIGCRMGLSVENNARSVGLNTTSTVVQSIMAVILLDAFFAVLFQELNI